MLLSCDGEFLWTCLQRPNWLENRAGNDDKHEVMSCISSFQCDKRKFSETQIGGNQLFCYRLNVSVWVVEGLFAPLFPEKSSRQFTYKTIIFCKHYFIDIIFSLVGALDITKTTPFFLFLSLFRTSQVSGNLQLNIIPFSLPGCLIHLPLLLWAPGL